MARVTPFHAGRSKKLGRIQAQELAKQRITLEFDSDVTGDFPCEVSYIAKSLGVPQQCISISDHPCGEYTIFERRGSKRHYQGYLDFWFYEDMDNQRGLGQSINIAYGLD